MQKIKVHGRACQHCDNIMYAVNISRSIYNINRLYRVYRFLTLAIDGIILLEMDTSVGVTQLHLFRWGADPPV